MPYTPPVAGSTNWDVALNAALADINSSVVQIAATDVNVKYAAYGAVGNGIADDTAAIQAAITAAFNTSTGVGYSGGGVVTLPTGVYLINRPIYLGPATVLTGTAQGGAAGTITLAASASAVDAFYAYARIRITSGTGSGQYESIRSYVGATKVATIGRNWATVPDATSTYEITSFPSTIRTVSLRGHGSGSTVIRAAPGFTGDAMVSLQAGGVSNSWGSMEDLAVDGAGVAQVGLHVGVVTERTFKNIYIHDVTDADLVVDATQNCTFSNIQLGTASVNARILNGAGNCHFDRIEMSQAAAAGIVFDADPTLPGYWRGTFGTPSGPVSNLLTKCLFEHGSTNASVPLVLNAGDNNTFTDCGTSTPSGSTAPYICTVGLVTHPLGMTCNGNVFERMYFYRGDTSGLPYVEVAVTGFNTTFDNCGWFGGTTTSDAVHLNNRAVFINPNFSGRQLQVITGSTFNNVQIVAADRVVGTTAQRPSYRTGVVRGARLPYYDTDEHRWIVYDELPVWHGLTPNVFTLTYGTAIATDAAKGSHFILTITNATAFTMSAPTNPTAGQKITYEIVNSSGGIHGLITWNAIFILRGGTFAVSNANREIITFIYNGASWVESGRTAVAAASGWVSQAEQHGLLAETMDPALPVNTQILSSGAIYQTRIYVPKDCTITNILLAVTTAGSGLTSGQNLAALYSDAGNKLSEVGDQTTPWATATNKTMALTTPQAITGGTYVRVMFLSVGTTPPTLRCGSPFTASPGLGLTGSAYRFASGSIGQTVLPASFTPSALTPGPVSWLIALS